MLSTLCCGLRNLLGLIGGEQPNNETEPFQYANANAELEGHERLRVDGIVQFHIFIYPHGD